MFGVLAILRIWSFGVATAGILVWLLWIRLNRLHWRYALPPTSWLVNAVAFYSIAFLDLSGLMRAPWWFPVWSVSLGFHASLLFTGVGLVMVIDQLVIRRRNNGS